MIIDTHAHIFAKGWVPRKFYHGIARFITHEFAKQGVYQTNEEIGDSLIETTHDPEAESLLAEMDEAGINKSVIFPIDFGLAAGDPEVPILDVNKHIAELAHKYPDRLIAFASVDPRRENALDLFVRGVEEWGMRGLKLHPSAGFYVNQKEVYPLLKKASDLSVPVIFHSSCMMMPWRSKYSQAIYFDDLAVDFPDLPIIAAHAGGMLGNLQMLAIMLVKINILVDISSWQVMAQKNYSRFCRALRDLMDFSEPERILFGTDTPSFRSLMSNTEWVQLIKDLPKNAPEGIQFTEEEIALVLGGNAQKLLQL